MSAWIVSKNHIDVLVYWFGKTECLAGVESAEGLTADQLGQELWRENHRSVNYRYSERRGTPAYHYTHPVAPTERDYYEPFELDNLEHAQRQLACYRYQTCERKDWERSKSHEWIEHLNAVLVTSLGYESEEQFYSDRNHGGKIPWGV